MCGVAGYFGKNQVDQDVVSKTLEALSHRGPDARGVYQKHTSSGKNILLLHTRLSIIDLDPAANQPMVNQNHVLCFNGELYNYQELKEELVAQGEQFNTTSDTEVLLKLLVRGGETSLDSAEGMWALAFYNEQTETLLLSRDRFGEKPLYIYEDDSGVYFASELKALFSLLPQKPAINYQKLYTYLFYGYRFLHKDSNSFFEGIKSLPPATIVTITDGRIRKTSSYWHPKISRNTQLSLSDSIESVKDALLSAVELRLRADVPIAFCMSGGVDSNSLISIAAREFNYDVHGFTIENIDERYDEKELVLKSVSELGIRHSFVQLSKGDFLGNLQTIIQQHQTPISTISYYVHWLLQNEIGNNGYKVSISGTGADELFSGYYDHFLLHLASIKDQSSEFENAKDSWHQHILPLVRNPRLQNSQFFIEDPNARQHLHADYSDFQSVAKDEFNQPFGEKEFDTDPLRNRMLNEIFHEVVPVILMEDDLNSMAFSIENRSPFLDRKLFEAAYSIPTHYLIQDGYAKYPLREAMKGILPEKVRTTRKKVGFNASLNDLLNLQDNGTKDIIFAEGSKIYDFVDREKIEKLCSQEIIPEKFLFNFLCAKFFLDQQAA